MVVEKKSEQLNDSGSDLIAHWSGMDSMSGFSSGITGSGWGFQGSNDLGTGGGFSGPGGLGGLGGGVDAIGGGAAASGLPAMGTLYDNQGFGPGDGFHNSEPLGAHPPPQFQAAAPPAPAPAPPPAVELPPVVVQAPPPVVELPPVTVHAPAPPTPIVDLPPVTALPPDGPLPSYGDLLAERQQRHYATDAEYRQFWREEQQRILKFGVGPVMDAIDLVRAPFQGRWGDAAWDALSLLGGKLFGAAGKWLAVSGLVARPVYQGVKLATPLGETTGFHSFRAFKKARGPAGPEMEWHHIVEQTPNKGRFPEEWLHNDLNVVRLDKKTHTAISTYYQRNNVFYQGRPPRERISQLPYEQQYEIGVEIMRQHGVNLP